MLPLCTLLCAMKLAIPMVKKHARLSMLMLLFPVKQQKEYPAPLQQFPSVDLKAFEEKSVLLCPLCR